MAKIYYDKDADLKDLGGRRIAILGYGSQGHAHALNLRDSGQQVVVGLPEGSRSRARAQAEGLRVLTPAAAAAEADIIMILTPDTGQPKLYREAVQPALRPGKTLMFAHGFNIRFGTIDPPKDIDVSMIAPKAPGHRVREVFVEGQGTPALLAVHQDASGKARPTALAYAKGIGCTRAARVRMLGEIRSGAYAKKWIAGSEAGRPWFGAQRKKERGHIIEEVGARLRGLMSFLDPVKVTPEGEVKPAREEARPAEVAR